MTPESKHNFLKPTNIFVIVGIFIPGFTAIAILGLQMLIALFGVECAQSWTILWVITTVASLLLPVIFFRYVLKTNANIENIKKWLTFFNVFEYTFIQATLGMFFSNGKTLCYVTDGQNGLQFVFTGWLAIPILIGLSLGFQAVLKKRNKFSVQPNSRGGRVVIEKKEPPSFNDVNAFLTNINFELPKGFIEFFTQSNGALIRGKNVYVELWRITDMIEWNKNYEEAEIAPDFFIFGSNDGGTAYFFEKKTGYIYEREFIAMPTDASFICKSFIEFLRNPPT